MSVEVRRKIGNDWEALAVPPPGQPIAYADCVHYIGTVAKALRLLYGLRFTGVEENTSVPTGWMSSGDADANNVARTMAERQRRYIAATQSGPTEPIAPSAPVSPDPSTSTAELTAASLDLGSNRIPIDIAATVQRRLSERPAEIRQAARALSEAIEDQIAHLNASKPNEADRLVQQNDFIAFLQTIAAGLDALADSIDRAIAAGSAKNPEPILLGKAGEIARQLSAAVMEGIERNRIYIVDCMIKFSVFAAGFSLLHAIGVDSYIAGAVAALMNVKLPKGEDAKK